VLRSRGLLFPLALIGIGILVLLANLGVLSSVVLERLADLWPLLLVIIGIQLILNHTLPRQRATALGLIIAALIVIGAVAYAALAPTSAVGTQHAESSEPVGGLSSGTLQLNYGAASVQINSVDIGDKLYQAKIDYPGGENPPTITVNQQSGTVDISDNGGFNGFHLFGSHSRKLVVSLSSHIPWAVSISGGASNLKVDLHSVQVNKLTVSGGASAVDAQLGQPKGTVPVHISGGASNLSVRIPSGSAWKVSVSGGLSSLTVDGQNSGGVGNLNRQSSGYESAADRFDIGVSGGVSHLELHTG
jgi:hypothetical protein